MIQSTMVRYGGILKRKGIENGRTALWVLLGLAGLYAITVWGHGSLFWGDHGRWLHEVERAARGEILYLDYTWPFPPLSLWLLSAWAMVFGSTLNAISYATAVVYFLIYLAFFGYVRLLIERRLQPGLVFSGFLLSISIVYLGGVSLPLGSYTPAAPMGFLFLLVAVQMVLRLIDRKFNSLQAISLGVLCGFCILTKQDYWLPALYLLGTGGLFLLHNLEKKRWKLLLVMVGGFVATIAVGSAVIVVQAGWDALCKVPSGCGRGLEFKGRGLPSWERLVAELSVSGWLISAILLSLVAGRALKFRSIRPLLVLSLITGVTGSLIHIFVSFRTGQMMDAETTGILSQTADFMRGYANSDGLLLKGAIRYLMERMLSHVFPLILIAGLALGLAFRWRALGASRLRNIVVFLVGLCLIARARRMFEYVEWYHILLEIPLYVLAIMLFTGHSAEHLRKGLRYILVLFVFIGAFAYWYWGNGPMSRRYAQMTRVETPRGVVYWRANEAKDYHRIRAIVDQLDPGGIRPIFAFGYTGGFNYFLNRPNPTPLTQTFRFSTASPADVVAHLRCITPSPILIDNAAYNQVGTPSGKISFRRWDPELRLNHYMTFDRSYFEAVLRDCKAVEWIPDRNNALFTVYNCP